MFYQLSAPINGWINKPSSGLQDLKEVSDEKAISQHIIYRFTTSVEAKAILNTKKPTSLLIIWVNVIFLLDHRIFILQGLYIIYSSVVFVNDNVTQILCLLR